MKQSIYFLLILVAACNSLPREGGTSRTGFSDFLSALPELSIGFSYDLNRQDAENCYLPDGRINVPFVRDSNPVLGVIKGNKNFIAIIYLEPGDDLYPVLETFDLDGNRIDKEILVESICAAWDCDYDSCTETINITAGNIIENRWTVTTTPCDSQGNKLNRPSSTVENRKLIMMDETGVILSRTVPPETR